MLAWILAVSAVFCLAYFVIIMLYSGIGTAFAIIWLLLGGLLGATAASVRYYQKTPERMALWIPVSLVTICASGMVVLLVMQILIFGKIPAVAEPNLDYVIVLGARVKPEGVSKTLKLRLDKAVEYALQNPETIMILSGGQGADEPVAEAVAMQDYLIEKGVKQEQLLLEDRSCNTSENMIYSRILMEEHHKEKTTWKQSRPSQVFPALEVADKPVNVGVLTSNFHLFRAGMIARKQGIEGIKGIAAESDRVLLIHFCLRDSLAILKDRLMGNL